MTMIFFIAFQVGSSTWLKHFWTLRPELFEEDFGHEEMHVKVPKAFWAKNLQKEYPSLKKIIKGTNLTEFNEFLQDEGFLTFSFIRHPFER